MSAGRESRGLVPGSTVDRVDVAAGLRELAACDYTDQRTVMVVDYALRRWARGEETAAERGAIDRTFYGIDLTSWRRVLAAACAAADPFTAAGYTLREDVYGVTLLSPSGVELGHFVHSSTARAVAIRRHQQGLDRTGSAP